MKITGRDWLFITLLAVFSLFGTKALFHPGLFTSHDGPHQVVRLYYYNEALADGQFPPRYILPSLHGYGYPLFIFSYHLPWLIGVPFLASGLSIYDCLKLLFALSFVLSGLTMYFWQKSLWGSRFAAFIGAFLYLWAPYRFSDIFVRGSLGEAWAFVFLPLVFFSLQGRSLQGVNLKIILGAMGLAGLILSHSLIFMLALPAFLFWGLICSLREWPNGLSRSVMVLSLGLGLSAFYLLPAFFLKQYTVFNQVMAGTSAGFADHFPSFKQLLYSPWGYGFSFPGANDAMSFQVGVGQWLAVLITVIIVILRSLTLPCIMLRIRTVIKVINSRHLSTAIVFLLIFAYSIFMMLPVSKPIWQSVNRFAYIDYPWRYLFLSVFAGSVLGGFAVSTLKPLNFKLSILRGDVLAGIFLIAVCLYTNRNHLRVNAWLDWPPQAFVGDGDTSNTFEEYTPLWADRGYIKIKRELIELVKGEGDVKDLNRKTNRIEFSVDNKTESDYRVNVFYFPQVKLTVDGRKTAYQYKDKGVLDFTLPAGKHQVKIEYKRTNLEKVSLFISGASLIIFLIAISKLKVS